MKNSIAKTLLAGLAGGLTLNFVMVLTFRLIGFGWHGEYPESLIPKPQAHCSMDSNGTPALGGISSGSDFLRTHSFWHRSCFRLPMACACMATRNQAAGMADGWPRIFSLISLLGVFYAFQPVRRTFFNDLFGTNILGNHCHRRGIRNRHGMRMETGNKKRVIIMKYYS